MLVSTSCTTLSIVTWGKAANDQRSGRPSWFFSWQPWPGQSYSSWLTSSQPASTLSYLPLPTSSLLDLPLVSATFSKRNTISAMPCSQCAKITNRLETNLFFFYLLYRYIFVKSELFKHSSCPAQVARDFFYQSPPKRKNRKRTDEGQTRCRPLYYNEDVKINYLLFFSYWVAME